MFGSALMNIMPNCAIGRLNKKTEAQLENYRLFSSMFDHYSNIAVTRYDWEGLPSSVSERFLNQTLYLFGQACFFEDETKGYLALPCSNAGEYNMYYEPTRINAHSFNYDKTLTIGDFVFIRNNPSCTPTAIHVMNYISRMCDVLRTIDVLCKKMKQPFIVLCEEKQRQTFLNLIKQISDNELLILGVKEYDLQRAMIDVKSTKIEADLAQLWECYRNYENLLYTILGINNTQTEKRERLIADEVNANNMVVEMSMEVNLKELQTACEEINEKYDLSISVSSRGVNDYLPGAIDNPTGDDE